MRPLYCVVSQEVLVPHLLSRKPDSTALKWTDKRYLNGMNQRVASAANTRKAHVANFKGTGVVLFSTVQLQVSVPLVLLGELHATVLDGAPVGLFSHMGAQQVLSSGETLRKLQATALKATAVGAFSTVEFNVFVPASGLGKPHAAALKSAAIGFFSDMDPEVIFLLTSGGKLLLAAKYPA
ncbi:MAG: hypothetical protein OXC07_01580 [Kistimonas sp.]|nr:hypothetical protein [Kistimonas sp.]